MNEISDEKSMEKDWRDSMPRKFWWSQMCLYRKSWMTLSSIWSIQQALKHLIGSWNFLESKVPAKNLKDNIKRLSKLEIEISINCRLVSHSLRKFKTARYLNDTKNILNLHKLLAMIKIHFGLLNLSTLIHTHTHI